MTEKKELRPYVDSELIQQIKERFSETKGMTATGVVDWALRYLMKLEEESDG